MKTSLPVNDMKTPLPVTLVLLVLLAGCAGAPPERPAMVEWSGHLKEPIAAAAKAKDDPSIPPITDRTLLQSRNGAIAKAETYSVVVRDADVNELLFALARDGNLDVTLHPQVTGKVTLKATDLPLTDLLERIATQVPLRWEIEGRRITILPDVPHWRTWRVDYVNVARSTSSTSTTGSTIGTVGGAAGAGAGGTGAGGAGGSGGASGGSGATGGGAGSRTTTSEQTSNQFWNALERNLTSILLASEPDAAVAGMDNAAGTAASGGATGNAQAAGSQGVPAGISGQPGTASSSQPVGDPRIIINRETGVVSILARRSTHGQLGRLIDEVLASARRQVLIEATVVEVTLSNEYETGIDWSLLRNNLTTTSPAAANSITSIGSAMLAGALGTAPALAISWQALKTRFGSLTAAVRMLDQFGKSRILSSPRLMVMNNQSATLKVIDNEVYFTLQVSENSTAQGGATTTQRTISSTVNSQPVGFMMHVAPFITDDDLVTLNIRPTVSRITRWVTDPGFSLTAQSMGATGLSNRIPVVEIREFESMLRVRSNDVAILGGLIIDSQVANTRGVPGAMDSAAGTAFRHDAKAAGKTELVVFLRPVVAESSGMPTRALGQPMARAEGGT